MRSFVFSLTVAFVTLIVVPVESVIDDQLQGEYQKSKRKLENTDQRKRRILGSLYRINRNMKKIEREKSILRENKAGIYVRVEDLKKTIDDKERRLDKQRKKIRKKMSAIYKLSGSGYFGILFSKMKSSDRDLNLKILSNITRIDARLIKDYQINLRSLELERKNFTAELLKLKDVELKLSQKEVRLKEDFKNKRKLIGRLKKIRKSQLKEIFQLRYKASKNEVSYMDHLLRPSIYEKKGRLFWPIEGKILREFGILKSEVDGVVLNQKGVFFSAPRGTAVKNIFLGTVVYAKVRKGYGKLIIIDHGDHYYSVYGNNSKIKVKVGQVVKAQSLLAVSGNRRDTFSRSVPGLYFEIRHFSEADDPMDWLLDHKHKENLLSSQRKGEVL